MAVKAELLVSHYQSTYDLTYKFWAQRNRLFLLLITVVGVATVLTYRPADTSPLLVAWVAKAVGLTNHNSVEALGRSFPYALLHGILLSIVFYLMFNLYHRAVYVLRSYAYLGALETEIRKELEIADDAVAFTRESHFYWNNRPALLGKVKVVYVLLLGALLGTFLIGRIWNDAGSAWLVGADLALSIPIGLFFFGYARSTLAFGASHVLPGNLRVDGSGGV